MKPRKGSKKNRLALQMQQGGGGRLLENRSDSDATLASASSDDTLVGGVVISGKGAGKGNAVGSAVMIMPSYHVLPPTQQRLLHHMSSIAQSIETGRAGNLVIYLKKLPTYGWPSTFKGH